MQTNVVSITATAEPLAELPAPSLPSEPISARARLAVKVPSWFTSGAALRVAQLKGVDHLLVLDRGAVVGTVATRSLALAPLWEPLARLMSPVLKSIPSEVSVDQARSLMTSLGLDCLPVTSGPLLVGLVTLGDLTEEHRLAG
jgi:CBS domain-containing protein